MPLYASPEQLMRERSELARKGIARGRSVVAMAYEGGVLLVAENPSTTLHKLSEIYDRIGFAAAGRYGEFESLRRAGIRHVDLWGYSYDRRDVSARQLANVYAQTLGSIFTEQLKPFEVEICVAQVGARFGDDELYRLTYDGSINDEPRHIVMGGRADSITAAMKETYTEQMDLRTALDVAIRALASGTGTTGAAGASTPSGTPSSGTSGNGDGKSTASQAGLSDLVGKLEVALLERSRPQRAFRRITGAALTALLPEGMAAAESDGGTDTPATGSSDDAG